jgi:lipopolysaccharide heptosyltransferase II
MRWDGAREAHQPIESDGTDSDRREPSDAHYDLRSPFDRRLANRGKLHAKRLVQRVLWVALGAVGRLTSLHLGPRPPLRPSDPRIRRILVVRVDLIGDVVLSLPAVRALRRAYPQAAIDLLVLPASAGVLAGERDIARVLTYDFNIWRRPSGLFNPRHWQEARAVLATLREPRYDLCVSVSGDWGSVLARLSGARRRVGYAGEAYPGMMTDPVPGRRYAVAMHEVEYVLRLARAAGGIVLTEDALPRLGVAPEAAAAIDRVLQRAGPGGSSRRPLVALHAGAQNGQAKRWPAASWAALADRLTAELGAQVILTGAPGDAPLAAAIRRRARRPVHDLAGQTSLPELVAVLARCDLVVSGDSGPLHIACAVGTPVVGLYGPTDPTISGPLAPAAIVLRRAIWCAPCYDASATADCRFSNPVCMKGLAPDTVFAAAQQQLARRMPEAIRAQSAPESDERNHEPATPNTTSAT